MYIEKQILVNAEAIKRWFDATTALFLTHQCTPELPYNTNEPESMIPQQLYVESTFQCARKVEL